MKTTTPLNPTGRERPRLRHGKTVVRELGVFCLALALLPLSAGGQVAAPIGIDVNNRAQVLNYLQANINNDNAIIAFYQKVGSWDRMRDLAALNLPKPIWDHLADARTRLVKNIYATVYKTMLTDRGIYLNAPTKTTHFIGTPPGDPNFKGVFSDLDVGMFLDPETRGARTIPARQALAIEAKRRMEKRLAQYGPDSGVLFDTNLYTTPKLRFADSELSPHGRQALDRYDDVLAYLAIRVGCGEDRTRWLDLKQRLLNKAQSGGLKRYVNQQVAAAENTYREYETIKRDALKAAGRGALPEIGDQAVTRHYEDAMLAFIREKGDQITANSDLGRTLRAQFNRLKADYEASLRESYFTAAAQTYIVNWKSLGPMQKNAFLGNRNKIRRCRADQARFILHYLHDPAGTAPKALRFKLQKIAKYEQRALNVLKEAKQPYSTPPLAGFTPEQVLALFTVMKGKATPEDAWVEWRKQNYNRHHKQDLNAQIPKAEEQKAEDYATIRAKTYLEKHIDQKLINIITELPTFQN